MNNNQFQRDNYYADFFFKQEAEKNSIKKLGFYVGSALCLFILIQYIIVLLMNIFGVYNDYLNNPLFSTGIDILISVFDILLPFLIFGKVMKKKTNTPDIAPFSKVKDKKLFVLSIFAGLGVCMLANIVTSYIVIFLEVFGITLSSPEIAQPQGVMGFILSVIRTSVVAALVEEIAMRGCVMQPLRKHSDSFAIIASACAFGLMHGNLIQAPFALIVGIALGYIVIKTGSLWSAVIIHALNNFISTFISYLSSSEYISSDVVNLIYALIVYSLIFIGIISLILFKIREKKVCPKTNTPISYLSPLQKAFAFIKSPTMIFAIIMLFITTASFVDVKWF